MWEGSCSVRGLQLLLGAGGATLAGAQCVLHGDGEKRGAW